MSSDDYMPPLQGPALDRKAIAVDGLRTLARIVHVIASRVEAEALANQIDLVALIDLAESLRGQASVLDEWRALVGGVGTPEPMIVAVTSPTIVTAADVPSPHERITEVERKLAALVEQVAWLSERVAK